MNTSFVKSLIGFVAVSCTALNASATIVHNSVNHSIVWIAQGPPAAYQGYGATETYSVSFPVYSESPVNLDPPMMTFNLIGSRTYSPVSTESMVSFETQAVHWMQIPGSNQALNISGGTSIGPDLFQTTGATLLARENSTTYESSNIGFSRTGLYGSNAGMMPFRMNLFGVYYYGWIRASVQSHYSFSPTGLPWLQSATLNIYDYAYESAPNTPLLAGAVPEPATAGMLILGGLALLRHRKHSLRW